MYAETSGEATVLACNQLFKIFKTLGTHLETSGMATAFNKNATCAETASICKNKRYGDRVSILPKLQKISYRFNRPPNTVQYNNRSAIDTSNYDDAKTYIYMYIACTGRQPEPKSRKLHMKAVATLSRCLFAA